MASACSNAITRRLIQLVHDPASDYVQTCAESKGTESAYKEEDEERREKQEGEEREREERGRGGKAGRGDIAGFPGLTRRRVEEREKLQEG